MLLKILAIFGINIDEELCYSEELLDIFENRFQQLIRFSIDDIVYIFDKYELKYEINHHLF